MVAASKLFRDHTAQITAHVSERSDETLCTPSNWPVGAVFGRAIFAAQGQKTLAFSFVILRQVPQFPEQEP
jgi:hypothetical protein